MAAVGAALGAPDMAEHIVEEARARLRKLSQGVAGRQASRKRVLFLEGVATLILSGYWIPEMVTLAGGRNLSQ